MIIVTGSVKARPDTFDELLRISIEHVRRSRLEAGCLLHSVHHDAEYPNRLVFLEYWVSRDALTAHFNVPASGEFARALDELATEPPRIAIYDAEALSF